MTDAADREYRAELTTFQCKECYVYRPPPASSIGHRAEFWDVDHWLQEVSLRIVTSDEDCTIRTYDIKTGALFAECGVPQDAPLNTVMEPVVDSSRERTEASDFNAALYEHTQYLRRKKEALEMREAYESTADEAGSLASSSQSSFSLKPGETITLKLAKTQLSPLASGNQPLPRLGSTRAQLPRFQAATATSGQIPLLAPPPAKSPGPTLARLSGMPGSSGKQTENSAQTSKASSSTADDAAATTSSAKTKEEGGMDDASIHAEPELAQDVQGFSVRAETSYVMIKPDGVQRALVGDIIRRFERKGFTLKALKMFVPTKELAEEHYKDLSAKPFFPKLVDYIISGPVIAMVWEGDGVVKSARKLIGATNPLEAEAGTIRGDLAIQTGRNVVHGSDSPENGVREAKLWFGGDDDMVTWEPSLKPWLVE
ncbi:hypothetical protein WJX82_008776 [Trebouxia sp. C0006]